MMYIVHALLPFLSCFAYSIAVGRISYYEAKGIAGNIIPAIATTNAIVAALQVSQAIKYIINNPSTTTTPATTTETNGSSNGSNNCPINMKQFPHTYCLRVPTRKGYFLQPTSPELPSATCYVCNTAQLTLKVSHIWHTLQYCIGMTAYVDICILVS